MPHLLAPHWLILIPAFLAVGWMWRHLGLEKPLRIIALLCGILALCDPMVGWLRSGMDLWVLIDRSDSCADTVSASEAEWLALLESSRPKGDDRMRVAYFADGVSRPDPDEGEGIGGATSMTRLRTAMQATLAQVSHRRPSRIVAITDGFSTESLEGISSKALGAGVPVDVRLVPPPLGNDARVSSFKAPQRILQGEPLVLDVEVSGRSDQPVTVAIFRDGVEMTTREITLAGGEPEILRFADRMAGAGAHQYEARVRVADDTIPGNNLRSRWVEVAGGSRVLLISRYPDDPLARMLSAQGFQVQVVKDPQTLHAGNLTGCRLVLFNNVGAFDIPRPFLESLGFFVMEQGGGLAMFGGEHSFGAGGYFESPIDELLPVSMELKAEHRKLAVAMAIVMDRSGSMGATVSDGRTKMQLADEGAARAVELLGAMDVVAVYAVDSKAHEMVPPLKVGENREKIIARVRRIQSAGGGIFLFNGLTAAVEALEKIPVGQRHIIVFSDAADTEQPGGYKNLLKNFVDDGGSVSVIGLGTRGDADAALLIDTAKRGNGRIFFTTDAAALPNIFAQETVTVARSTFLEDPVELQPTGSWIEVAGGNLEWLPSIDGYNLCYLREGGTAHLISKDEYSAPIVATMRRGLGRTAAITFTGGGDFSDRVRAWDRYGDFAQTTARWLAGDSVPPGVALRTKTIGTDLVIDLHFDPEAWDEVLGGTAPPIALAIGEGGGDTSDLQWDHLAPGQLRATRPLTPGEPARGAVQLGKGVLPFGPIVVGGEIEWDFDPSKPRELVALAKASGGRELVDLGSAWERPEQRGGRSLRNWLALAFLLLLLADALSSRMGRLRRDSVQVPGGTVKPKWKRGSKRLRRVAKPKEASSKSPPTEASPPVPPAAEEPKVSQGDLLRKAKSRRRP